MLRVAFLVDNTLEYDRRALLEIESLQSLPIQLDVYCNKAAHACDSIDGKTTYIRTFTNEHWEWRNEALLNDVANRIADQAYDVLHCHDHFMLHIGTRVKKKRPQTVLIYESRELFYSYPILYFEGNFINKLKSKVVRWLWVQREKRNAKHIDFLITVNSSLAEKLKRHFGLKREAIVTRNAGKLKSVSDNKLLRRHFNISDDKHLIVYAGVNVYPDSFCIRTFLKQVGNDKRFEVIFIASPNVRRKRLEQIVHNAGVTNVHFYDLVNVESLEQYLAGGDIGLIAAWDKKNLSYWYALDNKMFSYIMAGLPVLSTAQPEYQKVVDQFGVGVCINPESYNAFLDGLQYLMDNHQQLAANCKRARLSLNWEVEKTSFEKLYSELVAKHRANEGRHS